MGWVHLDSKRCRVGIYTEHSEVCTNNSGRISRLSGQVEGTKPQRVTKTRSHAHIKAINVWKTATITNSHAKATNYVIFSVDLPFFDGFFCGLGLEGYANFSIYTLFSHQLSPFGLVFCLFCRLFMGSHPKGMPIFNLYAVLALDVTIRTGFLSFFDVFLWVCTRSVRQFPFNRLLPAQISPLNLGGRGVFNVFLWIRTRMANLFSF